MGDGGVNITFVCFKYVLNTYDMRLNVNVRNDIERIVFKKKKTLEVFYKKYYFITIYKHQYSWVHGKLSVRDGFQFKQIFLSRLNTGQFLTDEYIA